jgi:hypothetical protein
MDNVTMDVNQDRKQGTDWFGTEHGPAWVFVNTVISLHEGNFMADWLVGYL